MEVKKTGNEVERVANESAPTYKPQEATEEVLVWLGFPKLIQYKGSRLWQVATFEHPAFYDDITYHDIEIQFYNHLYVLTKLYEKHTEKTIEIQHREDEYGVDAVYLNRKLVFRLYIAKDRNDGGLWVYKEQYLDEVKKVLQELLDTTPVYDLYFDEFIPTYWQEYAKVNLADIEIFDHNALLGSEQKLQYKNEKQRFIEALANDKGFAEKDAFFIIKPTFFGEEYLAKTDGTKLKDILNKPIDYIRIYKNLLVFGLGKTYAVELTVHAVELTESEKQKIIEFINSTKYMKNLQYIGYWGSLLGRDKEYYENLKAKPKQ